MSGKQYFSRTCQANGAITARQALKIVGDAGNGMPDVSTATADTDLVYGFAVHSAADNELVEVAMVGIVEAIASEALTVATHFFLTPAADGKLKPYAYGDIHCATFIGSQDGATTAAANDVILVRISTSPADTGV